MRMTQFFSGDEEACGLCRGGCRCLITGARCSCERYFQCYLHCRCYCFYWIFSCPWSEDPYFYSWAEFQCKTILERGVLWFKIDANPFLICCVLVLAIISCCSPSCSVTVLVIVPVLMSNARSIVIRCLVIGVGRFKEHISHCHSCVNE